MAVQRWRARWLDERGRQRELLFDSLNNRMIARIDFQLKCLHVASKQYITGGSVLFFRVRFLCKSKLASLNEPCYTIFKQERLMHVYLLPLLYLVL